jgi:hypothetical protein
MEAPVEVDFHMEVGPLDQRAQVGERRVVNHENEQVGVEEEVDPAAVGRRTAGDESPLAGKADNATLDGQEEEVEQVLPTGVAPCKEVEEDGEGGGDDEGDKMLTLAVEVLVATVVVEAPERFG